MASGPCFELLSLLANGINIQKDFTTSCKNLGSSFNVIISYPLAVQREALKHALQA